MYVIAAAILRLRSDINDLWNREGFSSDENVSEPLKTRLERNDLRIAADSEGWRSAFRTDVDHDSEVMPISVPNRSRSVLRL